MFKRSLLKLIDLPPSASRYRLQQSTHSPRGKRFVPCDDRTGGVPTVFGDLEQELQRRGFGDELIAKVVDSGYFLKGWSTFSGTPRYSVSDALYGNKALSSDFELEAFIRHLRGEKVFEALPPLNRVRMRSRTEIVEYLKLDRLRSYDADGSLTMRGQLREHRLRRAIPNPVRGNSDGEEISILPGLYRQRPGAPYSLTAPVQERRAIEVFSREIEPGGSIDPLGPLSRDFMHVEQHYARQTSGLDLTFDVEIALFFATNRFVMTEEKLAHYEPVKSGEHEGVIYLFRLGSPSVRRTEFHIAGFDYFQTHHPLRVIRQVCGLPYFGQYERNIAATDVDTVIELDPDFVGGSQLSPEYMFPNADDDKFYGKLLSLKDRFQAALADVVEYEWARPARSRLPAR